MKRFSCVAILLLTIFAFSGCGSVDKAFLKGVETYTVDSGLLNEYDAYVDKDQALDESSKSLRKGTSGGLRKLLLEARKNAGK